MTADYGGRDHAADRRQRFAIRPSGPHPCWDRGVSTPRFQIPFDFCEDGRRLDAEGITDAEQAINGDRTLAVLDFADVGPVHVGAHCGVLLRDAGRLTGVSKRAAHGGCGLVVRPVVSRHLRNLLTRKTEICRLVPTGSGNSFRLVASRGKRASKASAVGAITGDNVAGGMRKLKRSNRLSCAAVAFVVASVGASPLARAANIIVNGDFETGSLTPSVANGGPNNDVIVVASVGTNFFGAGSAAADGNYLVAFNAGNSPPGGTLSQTFNTLPGARYSVAFDYGTNGSPETIHAVVNGVGGVTDVRGSLDVTATFPPAALATRTFGFTADGSTSTLVFLDDSSNPTVSVDGVLDNVSVTAVPEPGLAASLAAVGGIGLLICRGSGRTGRSRVKTGSP